MHSQALIPVLLSRAENKLLANVLAIVGGVFLFTVLAQIAIPLPWTPVPITGQTLGVALIGLSWGWRRSLAVVGTYLLLGVFGLPVFANAAFSPTFGYLLGMLFAASFEGWMGDCGFTKNFWSALATTYMGSIIIFACGLFVLSFFVPAKDLLWAGFYPFLLGDCLKNIVASGLRSQMQALVDHKI